MEDKMVQGLVEEKNKGGTRVLLVEDDEFLRDICKRKLELDGFNVSVAVNGKEALKKITEEVPQVVLLDVVLPDMDGFEVLSNLKGSPIKSQVAVIMLTNLGQKTDIEQGMKLGADAYIVKAHFTVSEIIQKIKTVLKNKKYAK
jgi:DNA-binding response OmpR family regulator